MEVLIALALGLLKIILPAILNKSNDSYAEAHRQKDLTMNIKSRINNVWGQRLSVLLLCCFLSACYTKTIYVPDQVPVRLRQELKDVKVWVVAEDGSVYESTMDLKEGWFVISLPQYGPEEHKETEEFEQLEK